MSTGTFSASGVEPTCSSTAWNPASSSRKTSGPNSIMSDRPMAESTE